MPRLRKSQEDIVRCPEAQRLSRTVRGFVHDLLDFCIDDGRQVPVFREELPDKAAGVLVQPALPGGIRMGEIDPGITIASHALMVGELAAIVM